MTRLNQILAVEKGLRTRTEKRWTEIYRQLDKVALLSGISRTYTPKDDEGERLPSEQTLVQVRSSEELDRVRDLLVELWNVTATKEAANTTAKADVRLEDSAVLATGVPVTTLLFLEKQLTELRQFLAALPVLDPAKDWHWDENRNCYATPIVQTTRSKKLPRNHVKAEATDKHPAQVEVYYEDMVVGTWDTVNFSGAVPRSERDQLVGRVQEVLDAVKRAREEANTTEIEKVAIADPLLNYVLRGPNVS